MNRSLVIIVIILIAIVGGVVWTFSAERDAEEQAAQEQATQTDAERFAEEYPQTPENNRFVYVTSQEIVEVFESGTGLVFLGFPECPWCQVITPILHEAAVAENLDEIYYYNIREDREGNNPVYQQLVEKLEEHLRTDEDGIPRIFVPDITAVRDGEIVGRFEQEQADEGEEVTPDTFWAEERTARGVEQIQSIIRETQNNQ